ncbi:MAG TPA: hypothetical protein DCS28_03590 [Candidatus Moranbacteria bacterium]|nr:hypothetical protein [Candidatus Moranbacteria bacterium]HAT75095.1 hypothetical protein [Candidatus Moranbacteria bacterium]
MKNKIRGLAYGISVAALAAPAIVFGAFDPTAGGGTGLPEESVMNIVANIMNWLLTAIGIAGVIGFAISGILYLTAAGDEDKIKKAKSAMVASIIGVLVAIAGVVALRAASGLLGGATF